ncbi:MAG: hypothetical protein J2P36_31185 [Ktedonobacteraceae bacterium]|nr:hypothetical protein [Ktedonobacteraceae bacterium]
MMRNEIPIFQANRKKKEWERRTNMRKLWVKAWMTLDGVFDADTMDHWWSPKGEAVDYARRIEYIVVPYIMGRGRRFWTSGTPQTALQLVSSKMLSGGTLAAIYQPDKNEPLGAGRTCSGMLMPIGE